jgi:hypothetical protein
MERVEAILNKVDRSAELEIVKYAASAESDFNSDYGTCLVLGEGSR